VIGCNAQNCKELKQFKSFEEALVEIKNSDFNIKETADVLKSSWIKNANFYSCDESVGYLIIMTSKRKEYIHENVPLYLWRQFRNSDSLGKFYNSNFKNKYKLQLK